VADGQTTIDGTTDHRIFIGRIIDHLNPHTFTLLYWSWTLMMDTELSKQISPKKDKMGSAIMG
jgi:hypothetical protein